MSGEAPHPVARVQAALEGRESGCIAVFEHSVLLLGEHQFYPGYCVLWARDPVKELQHLPPPAYGGFMLELRRACEAVERAYQPWKLNLASLGNQVQHLHFHLFPRQADDAQKLRHPWASSERFSPVTPAQHEAAMLKLKAALQAAPN